MKLKHLRKSLKKLVQRLNLSKLFDYSLQPGAGGFITSSLFALWDSAASPLIAYPIKAPGSVI